VAAVVGVVVVAAVGAVVLAVVVALTVLAAANPMAAGPAETGSQLRLVVKFR